MPAPAAPVLVVSISGIRGIVGHGLDPQVMVSFVASFGTWCRRKAEAAGRPPLVAMGRDGRVTGPMYARLVEATLQSVGCHVLQVGLATTPTVQIAVEEAEAIGGLTLSASHNPAEWNALKLFNERGEYLGPEEAQTVIDMVEAGEADYVAYDQIGDVREQVYLDAHLDRILAAGLFDPARIQARGFRVVVDAINSVGALAVPALLARLGIEASQVVVLNATPDGRFAHTPEPLPQHLTATLEAVREHDADLGLVVDPDVDRLALVGRGGVYVNEELTQVLCADFIWRRQPGPYVTNLSSSRAIDDVAARYGMTVHRSKVGEINVVKKMQAVGAVMGGEGSGGIIVPAVHYGRDALVGIAMILQHLAEQKRDLLDLVKDLPAYAIVKQKMPLDAVDASTALAALSALYADQDDVRVTTTDGVKLDWPEGWVHVRPSNTEPILRIYAEGPTTEQAEALIQRVRTGLDTNAP
ncbi:MAG: phosphoglucosamine mutase [Bacteroidota bacterium]